MKSSSDFVRAALEQRLLKRNTNQASKQKKPLRAAYLSRICFCFYW